MFVEVNHGTNKGDLRGPQAPHVIVCKELRVTSKQQKAFLTLANVNVHESTIRRTLNNNGVHGRVARRKPLLSKRKLLPVCIFPTAFKQAGSVTPLLTKPTLNTSLSDSYRPVSLLPFIAKTLERVVFNISNLFDRITNWMLTRMTKKIFYLLCLSDDILCHIYVEIENSKGFTNFQAALYICSHITNIV